MADDDHPLVTTLHGAISFSEEDNPRDNIRISVTHGRDILVAADWGYVSDANLPLFLATVAKLLSEGYRVAVDSRGDRTDGPIMVHFDLDADKAQAGFDFGGLDLARVAVILTTHVRAAALRSDCNSAARFQCSVFGNASKPGSYHIYFHNVFVVDVGEFRDFIKLAAGALNAALAHCGLHIDAGITAMVTLRWPMTYAFRSFSGDDRHVLLGIYQENRGMKKVSPWGKEAQTWSPLDGCYDTSRSCPELIVPAGLEHLLRGYIVWLPASNGRATITLKHERRKRGLSAALESPANRPALEPFVVCRDNVAEVDFCEPDVYFEVDEARKLLKEHGGPGQELFEYLARRVAILLNSLVLKLRDCGTHDMSLAEIKRGVMSLPYKEAVIGPNGEVVRYVKKDAWDWYEAQQSCRYHRQELEPYCLPLLRGKKRRSRPLILNVWCGFVVYPTMMMAAFHVVTFGELVAEADLCAFMYHLFSVLCNNSITALYRLLCWVRAILLYPARPIGKIIINDGPGGVGKSGFVHFLETHVFGREHARTVSSARYLTGRFNGFTGTIVVGMVDEGGVGSDESFQTLKQLTTASTRNIEKKYKETITTTAPLNVYFSCNNIDCALIAHERRFDVISADPAVTMECGDELLLEQCYDFGALCHDPVRGAALSAAFVCLITRFLDASAYQRHKHMPFLSPGYVKMRHAGMSPLQRFWAECLSMGCNCERKNYYSNPGDEAKVKCHGTWGTFVPLDWVVTMWLKYKTNNGMQRMRGDNKHQTMIEALLSFGCSVRTEEGVQWLMCPALSHARAQFEQSNIVQGDERDMEYQKLTDFSGWRSFWFWDMTGVQFQKEGKPMRPPRHVPAGEDPDEVSELSSIDEDDEEEEEEDDEDGDGEEESEGDTCYTAGDSGRKGASAASARCRLSASAWSQSRDQETNSSLPMATATFHMFCTGSYEWLMTGDMSRHSTKRSLLSSGAEYPDAFAEDAGTEMRGDGSAGWGYSPSAQRVQSVPVSRRETPPHLVQSVTFSHAASSLRAMGAGRGCGAARKLQKVDTAPLADSTFLFLFGFDVVRVADTVHRAGYSQGGGGANWRIAQQGAQVQRHVFCSPAGD